MVDRTTSVAKEILTPAQEAVLEKYGIARHHFDHARDPMISQQLQDLAQEKAREAERGSIFEEGHVRGSDDQERQVRITGPNVHI